MQTRIGLRTVRKSGSDVSRNAPQEAVSPFHPPVKLDEKNLKTVANEEERPTKRRSTRLNNNNSNKNGQRTLFESFPSVHQTRATAATTETTNTNSKKRASIASETTIQQQPKKQRVHREEEQNVKEDKVEKSQEQLNEKEQEQTSTIDYALETEQARKEEPSQPLPIKTPKGPVSVKPIPKIVTNGTTTKKTIIKKTATKIKPPIITSSSTPSSTCTHKALPKQDASTAPIEKKLSMNDTTQSLMGDKESVHVEKAIEKKIDTEKAKVHEVSSKAAINAKSRDDNSTDPVATAKSNTQEVPVWKKSFVFQSDEARVQDEKSTLHKLRNALDMSLMFHAANQRIAVFHKIQPMLRNSTKKNVTIHHLAKILYVAPKLYAVSPKLLGVNGTQMETYAVELGSDWKAPLSGKQLEQRENILADKMESYFIENKGKLVIPEKELPRIEKVVDRKKWIETANLPSGVRDLLQLEERRKEQAEKAKATLPALTGTGTVKDRRQALLERIRAKSKK